MKQSLLAFALVLVPALAGAQTVNPTRVVFDSPDHQQVTRYDVGYFIGSATSPAQTVSVPVDQVTGSGTTNLSLLLARPIFGSNLTVKLRAVAGTAPDEAMSAWSGPTVPFVFSPLAPTVRGLQ
jgi:carbon starvation protein CstA